MRATLIIYGRTAAMTDVAARKSSIKHGRSATSVHRFVRRSTRQSHHIVRYVHRPVFIIDAKLAAVSRHFGCICDLWF
jgi:hypothetical protein